MNALLRGGSVLAGLAAFAALHGTAARLAAQGLPRARPAELGLDSARLADVRTLLDDAVARGEVAGVVTLLARNGRVAAVDSAGFQDTAGRARAGLRTLFRIGSMTKPVTSVAAMILVEEGALRLSDPVARYLPELAGMRVMAPDGSVVPARTPITVRHLLTHRAGFTYGFLDDGPVGDAYRAGGVSDGVAPREGETIASNVARLARVPLAAEPGTRFVYGLSTDVLGRVVEVASGESLARYLSRRIFEPLGMHDTAFHVDSAAVPRLAAAFAWNGRALRPLRGIEQLGLLRIAGEGYHGSRTWFSGGSGLVSTAGDYARFLQMILNGGELDGARILSARSVALLGTDAIADLTDRPLGPGAGFGLGFQVLTDTALAEVPGSEGTLSWSGVYGTTFWADRERRLIGIVMLQRVPSASLGISGRFRRIAYAAVTR
ncbi:MAG TPA: serine hydrolase domain-containing protein [Gemmatimonadales bacterium]